MQNPIKNEWAVLALFFVACFAVAGLGSLATNPEIPTWYAKLKKPSWTPPNWLFGPVWSVLYAAMAIAGWMVWKREGWRVALTFFAAQLALNLAWSFVFFKFHNTGLAFAEIVLLWVAILATAISFAPISKVAAALFVPYLIWVTYAAALNFSIWRLND